MRSFQTLAAEPGAPLKRLPANGRDAMHWLKQASVKLNDAGQSSISASTRMDAALAWVSPFLAQVGQWFKTEKVALVKQGLAP